MEEFIRKVSELLNTEKDLVEIDLLLHQLLLDLSKTEFAKEFAFKGGSCLIKHYLGYFRFSLDLDFTFLNQKWFKGLSQKKIRRILSKKTDQIGSIFEDISKKRNLDFKCEKGNRKYVEFGGGGKLLTFKLWYTPISGPESFIKIQINFVDRLIFPIKEVKLNGPLPKSKELGFLFPDSYKEYRTPIKFKVYALREILCEKVRAILTRRGIKERDFIDIYLISKEFELEPETLEREILEKTKFILNLYLKYRMNLKEKFDLLSVENFPFGSENYLLLTEVDKGKFYSFLGEFMGYLKKLGGILMKNLEDE